MPRSPNERYRHTVDRSSPRHISPTGGASGVAAGLGCRRLHLESLGLNSAWRAAVFAYQRMAAEAA